MAAVSSRNADAPALLKAMGEPDFFPDLLDGLSEAVYLVDRRRTIRY